jgi:uncharacterized heparinase superfamily protein
MSALARYWHTIRHLRPVQLYGRVWFRLAKPRMRSRAAPPVRRWPERRWTSPAPHRVGLVAPDSLVLLNETRALSQCGWDDPAVDKLWRYNLHYFDDLTAAPSPARAEWQRALMTRWVSENPLGTGTGWEPYPTSLRIVNWIKWAFREGELPPSLAGSLADQARWLSHRLEIHLLGNHLFANAKALVFAGLYFEGPEADGWLERGLSILEREIPEQILPDGGQFELSPMYHALAVEDMLDLYNATQAFAGVIPERWRAMLASWPSRIGAMRHWMLAMRHPDGEIGLFNDAAFGIAPAPAALGEYAERLGLGGEPALSTPVAALNASGYLRVERGGAIALLDVARIGPDYLPGHAHADTLSFELSIFGQRVLVNSGTSQYGAGPERLRQRGTAAHNTVVVDRSDSSEVWGGFRVARRASPVALSVTIAPDVVVRCAHDGYRWLPGSPVHAREWRFAPGRLVVEDRVAGRFTHAEARFHLHPTVTLADEPARASEGTAILLRLPAGQHVRFAVEQGSLRVEPSTWHPEFGRTVTNLCLVVRLEHALSRIQLAWGDAA